MVKEELIDWNEYPCGANSQIYSHAKKRMLKGTVHKNGYVYVLLKCVDGKQRLFLWHRVIYTYFYGTIPEGMQVNHINEDKTDNRLCNLELVTHIQNCNHATRNERSAKKRSKKVVALDMNGNVVLEFASTHEAGRNGFDQGSVVKCCKNCFNKQGNNIYKGLRWYYA